MRIRTIEVEINVPNVNNGAVWKILTQQLFNLFTHEVNLSRDKEFSK